MENDYSDLGFKSNHQDLGFIPQTAALKKQEIPSDFDIAGSLKQGGRRLSDVMGGAGETFYNIPENVANFFGKHLYEKGDWGRESGATSTGRFLAPFLLGGPEGKLAYGLASKVLPEANALQKALRLGFSGGVTGGSVGTELGQDPSMGAAAGALGAPLLGQATPAAFNALKSPFSALLGRIPENELVKNLQTKASSVKNNLSNMFDYVKNESVKRDVPNISIEDEIFKKVERYLPKTRAFKDLVNQAKTGDYNALRSLQSDLGNRSEKALSHELNAERNKGFVMQEARDDINQSIRNHLIDQGHPDLANTLDEARKGYKSYIETYFGNNKLAKIFGEDKEIPSNALNTFKTDSVSMNRFKNIHPEVIEQLEKHEKAQKLGKIGKWGAGVVGGGLLGDYLLQKLMGLNK